MTAILDPHKQVPMMFRAQVNGRCQLQRLIKDKEPDIVRWADEWVDKVYPEPPAPGEQVKTRDYTISWRLITNSGVDDSIIRPVIGARGWVFFPGSSMKGLFRRACRNLEDKENKKADKYCGKPVKKGDWAPGSLRFHGGYPIDTSWIERLVDIVHPQQGWQVQDQSQKSSALAQISLYKPTLRFGISSTDPDVDWDDVWQIWEKAIAMGIGSRICAGYGQVETLNNKNKPEPALFRTRLKGQGQTAKLIDGTAEFRSNMFRATLRGHALRLFGGLTDAQSAEKLVETLFGGVQGKGTVGLLGVRFQTAQLQPGEFGKGSYAQPTYTVEGELACFLARELDSPEHRELLQRLVACLTQFSMVFGGFGKSWRRADHRLFFEEYYQNSYKALIGCHWQWSGALALRRDVQVRKLEKVGEFIEKVRQTAQEWMQVCKVKSSPNHCTDWREAWHPQNVEVWGREAENRDESEAIEWFHGPYQERIARVQDEGSIYKSTVTGRVGEIGRIWHRMYPVVRLSPPTEPQGKPIPRETPRFLELLTIFPDDSIESEQFLKFLESRQGTSHGFQRLWGGE